MKALLKQGIAGTIARGFLDSLDGSVLVIAGMRLFLEDGFFLQPLVAESTLLVQSIEKVCESTDFGKGSITISVRRSGVEAEDRDARHEEKPVTLIGSFVESFDNGGIVPRIAPHHLVPWQRGILGGQKGCSE